MFSISKATFSNPRRAPDAVRAARPVRHGLFFVDVVDRFQQRVQRHGAGLDRRLLLLFLFGLFLLLLLLENFRDFVVVGVGLGGLLHRGFDERRTAV